MERSYFYIFPPESGREYASFYLYLPAGREGYFAEYRFCYEENPVDPALGYREAPNNPANRKFYRVKEAYIGTLDGGRFTPSFRALQSGELGFAFREEGEGDFVGGVHGDEIMENVRLTVDGEEIPLNAPRFGAFDVLCFEITSVMTRCNTPHEKLIRHTQKYTVSGGTVSLHQHILWIADAMTLQAAYTPLLTAQRLDPKDPDRILTDTVEFYGKDGELLTAYDTAPYGKTNGDRFSDSVCMDTPAYGVKVYGKRSGFSAEASFRILGRSIPEEQISAFLCIRYKKCLDNKIYFDVGKGTAPRAGTVWEKEIVYRLNYDRGAETCNL